MSLNTLLQYWHLGIDCYYKLTSGNEPLKRHTCLQFLEIKSEIRELQQASTHYCGIDTFVLIVITNVHQVTEPLANTTH